jgi:hypothetical protein
MHNGQLANPFNEFAKNLKEKTKGGSSKKTDEQLMGICKEEWYGGLYLTNQKPCIPGELLESCFAEAAKNFKKGKQAKGALWCPNNAKLIYDGPTDILKLWENENFRFVTMVRIKKDKILRTRPIFKNWSAEIEVLFDPTIFNDSDIDQIVNHAGTVGIMDYRPKYGRFTVKKI